MYGPELRAGPACISMIHCRDTVYYDDKLLLMRWRHLVLKCSIISVILVEPDAQRVRSSSESVVKSFSLILSPRYLSVSPTRPASTSPSTCTHTHTYPLSLPPSLSPSQYLHLQLTSTVWNSHCISHPASISSVSRSPSCQRQPPRWWVPSPNSIRPVRIQHCLPRIRSIISVPLSGIRTLSELNVTGEDLLRPLNPN